MNCGNVAHRLDSTRLELVIHHATGSKHQDCTTQINPQPVFGTLLPSLGEGLGMRVGDPLRLESKEPSIKSSSASDEI